MKLPKRTSKDIHAALKRFDDEFRNSPEWIAFEDNHAHKYAVSHEGRLYPVKKILTLATGVLEDQFSGGAASNKYLMDLGFDIKLLHPEEQADADLQAAIRKADRAECKDFAARAEDERQHFVSRFPIERWPSLRLEDYALGHKHFKDSICYIMEFAAPSLGSIRGGSSGKFVIYWSGAVDPPGWIFPKQKYSSPEDTWTQLREGFVQAFEAVKQGRWETIEDIDAISWTPALLCKLLHVYFPDQFLGISSKDHLTHFLGLFGHPAAELSSLSQVRLNRTLLGAMRAHKPLASWNTEELGRFLYIHFHPNERDTRLVFKIAPGHNAELWDDCFENGYIRVGWDDVGICSSMRPRARCGRSSIPTIWKDIAEASPPPAARPPSYGHCGACRRAT